MSPMIELLAIPAWRTAACTLEDWTNAFAQQGHNPVVSRDEDEVWLEIAPLRLRGFVALEAGRVEAINFELHDPESEAAAQLVEEVSSALGWEVHADEAEEDNLDED